MKTIISLSLPNFIDFIPEIDLIIAASETVKQNLVRNYNLADKQVIKINDFSVKKQPEVLQQRNSDFIVGGSGTVHWRKGSDLFLQLAQITKSKYPDLEIKFQWIGAISNTDKIIYQADIEKAELSEVISFDGEKENPGHFISQFSVFVLPSREDPFPLVAIEAGMQAKPIICFEQGSGTAEIVKNGGGFVVPYLDIESMAEKIVFYYKNPEKLIEDGQKAKQLFKEFTPENICPKIFAAIKNIGGE
ncbi:glycosyltransferase family 4 protein [Antarcticibacterium sp. 1MA-6-2]|uniref:glycosyltransferase family 4 protein n=1 Tax=Antarcticibacterium sp. 1MA-6-2 TaxID=2908210 RepID=UPI001F3E29A6|nr:glycosyltransferase family 4 protein [Antarcticibacterium sp. 1MA-6-2]UJH92518.1 glycosyltransferase family 4 protein [Antarcticibacterium sp. 1MA-6-2]